MIKIKCKECKNTYEVDEEKLVENYIQCPYCSRIAPNPLK